MPLNLAERCEFEFERYVEGLYQNHDYTPVPWYHAGIRFTQADIPRLKRQIRAALEARLWFSEAGPGWAQRLPLSLEECLSRAQSSPGILLAHFSSSLWRQDYDYRRHPPFEGYCRGVLAHPDCPAFLRDNPELGCEFPPKPLPGLGDDLYWRPPP